MLENWQEVLSAVNYLRNPENDVFQMYECFTDIFPGIEDCIETNLSLKENCTEKCT